VIDLSDVGTEITVDIEAPPEAVWALMTDLGRTPTWNRETRETAWVPPAHGPTEGAVFRAVNQIGSREWTVDCHVIVATAPSAFEWTVLDPSHPSTRWWYRLAPTPSGTTLRHGFQHGPGPSGLRSAVDRNPDGAAVTIAGRVGMLEANMRHTVTMIKAVAEGR
jgi:uncharacterized protein YndB with AHSA1/START domain